jgi:hypothetical protein
MTSHGMFMWKSYLKKMAFMIIRYVSLIEVIKSECFLVIYG